MLFRSSSSSPLLPPKASFKPQPKNKQMGQIKNRKTRSDPASPNSPRKPANLHRINRMTSHSHSPRQLRTSRRDSHAIHAMSMSPTARKSLAESDPLQPVYVDTDCVYVDDETGATPNTPRSSIDAKKPPNQWTGYKTCRQTTFSLS